MTILSISSLLIGALLGLRFTVWVLVPAIAFSLFAVVAIGTLHSHSFGSIGLAMLFCAVGLQAGYLAGISTRFIIAAVHAPRTRKIATVSRQPSG